jgi:hypothetical protein
MSRDLLRKDGGVTVAAMNPVEGSIQWAMDRGTLFQVEGIAKYGMLTACTGTPIEAARFVLYRGEE